MTKLRLEIDGRGVDIEWQGDIPEAATYTLSIISYSLSRHGVDAGFDMLGHILRPVINGPWVLESYNMIAGKQHRTEGSHDTEEAADASVVEEQGGSSGVD